MESFPVPDKKDIITILLFFSSAVVGSYAVDAAFLLLVLLSLVYKTWPIKALTLMMLLIFVNPGLIIMGGSNSNLLRWAVIGIVAFVSIIRGVYEQRQELPKWEVMLFFFSLCCLVTSYLTSYNFKFSALKITIFTVAFLSVNMLFRSNKAFPFGKWFMALFLVVLISSLLILPFPVARMRNGVAFQGILNQPNAFGIFLAPFAAWVFGLLFGTKEKKSRIIYMGLLLVTLSEMYLSFSRTSFLAFIGSATVSFLISLIHRKRKYGIVLKTVIMMLFTLVIIGWFVDMFSPKNIVVEKISSFIFKNGLKPKTSETKQEILSSRRAILDRSLEHFFQKPFFGNGFGIASDENKFLTTSVGWIPVGAAVEKGFLITALLEDTGVFGTLLFFLFLIQYAKVVAKFGDLKENMVLWCAFFLSFGEMIFFSPGGLGMYVYLLMAFARWMAIQNKITQRLQMGR